MKAKKIVTLALAAAMVSVSALSVSAATLTNTNQSGQTEVKGYIGGVTPPGNVTYEIRIPDSVDFGDLMQYDDYANQGYDVSLEKVENLGANQQISVYVKDQNAQVDGNQNFYITNKSNSNVQLRYHVFKVPFDQAGSSVPVNSNTMTKSAGYFLEGFRNVGDAVHGSLVLNKDQFSSYDSADLVGEYSGYMVFYSTIEDQ